MIGSEIIFLKLPPVRILYSLYHYLITGKPLNHTPLKDKVCFVMAIMTSALQDFKWSWIIAL